MYLIRQFRVVFGERIRFGYSWWGIYTFLVLKPSHLTLHPNTHSMQPRAVYVTNNSPMMMGGNAGQPVIFAQSPSFVPAIPPLGRDPVNLTCPTCRNRIRTTVEPKNGTCCRLTCGVGLFLLAAAGSGCIPLCISGCTHLVDDFEHSCPCCNSFLGIYKII